MVGGRSSPADAAPAASYQPKLVTDPVWCLKPWPVVFTVVGADLTIPALHAADWLQVLMDPKLTTDDVVPGMLDAVGGEYVEEALHAGALDWIDLQDLSLEIISTVSARPWWVAMRLICLARDNWDAVGGELALKCNPDQITLGAWLDAAFLLILRAIEDDKRTMFLMKLEMPPPGWEPEEEELEMSPDAFMAMAGE